MLTTKEKSTLLAIVRHCNRIEEKVVVGITEDAFYRDDDLKEIVAFNILQIGELAKNLSPAFTKKYSEVPWKDIKGMRDWVAHGYGTMDLSVIWKTASVDIKPLREYCERILAAEAK